MQNQFLVSPFFLDQPLPRLSELAQPGWTVSRPSLGDGDMVERLADVHRPISDFVAGAIGQGRRPVCISGDCVAAIAMLGGLQRARVSPALIWFDAHGDFNTWETSPSGFLGGMPLAMLVGRGDQRLNEALDVWPLSEDRVILTDARDLDPGERESLENSRVNHIPDVGGLLETGLPAGPIWVHFDTDVIPAEEAPAQNYPVKGGSPPAVIRAALERLASSGRVVAASLSSWAPAMDPDGKSRDICMSVFGALLDPS